jgi:hypothetical protein
MPIASNCNVTLSNEFRKEGGRKPLRYYPSSLFGEAEEILSQHRLSPGRDWNRVLPEYETEVASHSSATFSGMAIKL